ncbi:MAG: hypothetical protein IPK04_06145 [Bdellovibrionales bacterium]|nr:hypothetical protein [Bdellovibrionales bacterium]
MSPVTKSLTFTIVLLLGTLGTYNANASWQHPSLKLMDDQTDLQQIQ